MKTVSVFLSLSFCFTLPLIAQEVVITDSAQTSSSEEVSTGENVTVPDVQLARDPFVSGMDESAIQPGLGGAPALPEPVLQGIARSGDKAAVVIGGKTYVQGDDTRNGIQLVEVRKGEADIIWGGQTRTLRFSPKKKEKKQPLTTSQTNPTTPVTGPPDLSGAAMTDSGEIPAPMEDSK